MIKSFKRERAQRGWFMSARRHSCIGPTSDFSIIVTTFPDCGVPLAAVNDDIKAELRQQGAPIS